MTYITTPDLGLELADPQTVQAFETTNVNSNFLLLEAGIVADRVRLTAEEAESATIAAGVGRGNLARKSVVAPSNLTAIADGIVGDRVLVTTPGTGISPFWAEMISGSGAGADWVPAEEIVAATKSNLDSFITAWTADADLMFRAGRGAYIADESYSVRFLTTAGGYVPRVIKSQALGGAILSVTFAAIPTNPMTQAVVVPALTSLLVRVKLTFQGICTAGTTDVGVAVSGGTTIAADAGWTGAANATGMFTATVFGAALMTYTIEKIVKLSAGTNTFEVQARLGGAGGTKQVSAFLLTIEPV